MFEIYDKDPGLASLWAPGGGEPQTCQLQSLRLVSEGLASDM